MKIRDVVKIAILQNVSVSMDRFQDFAFLPNFHIKYTDLGVQILFLACFKFISTPSFILWRKLKLRRIFHQTLLFLFFKFSEKRFQLILLFLNLNLFWETQLCSLQCLLGLFVTKTFEFFRKYFWSYVQLKFCYFYF